MTDGRSAGEGIRGVIAAGGTGGHLFPAQALAQELYRRGCHVWLMTDERVNRYGESFPCEEIVEVRSATISPRAPLKAPAALMRIAAGTWTARTAMKRIRPAFLAGFGGYPTLPPLLAARLCGVPTCLHEQNAVMGRVNRLLAGRVTAVASTFENPKFLPASARGRTVVTGNPVRDAVLDYRHSSYAPPDGEGPLRLLVFGGSQGARAFSDIVPPAIETLPDALRDRLVITQQCRPEDLERVSAAYGTIGVQAEIAPFFSDMPKRMAESHLVICRSGASTLSELGVIGRPAMLVPLPHSLDGDQLHNARAFVEAGGGWLHPQDDLTPARAGDALAELLGSPDRLAAAAQGARTFGRPDAVSALADLVLSISGKQRMARNSVDNDNKEAGTASGRQGAA